MKPIKPTSTKGANCAIHMRAGSDKAKGARVVHVASGVDTSGDATNSHGKISMAQESQSSKSQSRNQ